MISWLTNATKRRIIEELKKILYDHPRYRDDSKNVQNKFAFDERPQRGIIVNGVSGDRVRLSADNYMGRLSSFCMLSYEKGYPGTTVEWIRENFTELEKISPYRDKFPSAPGVYRFQVSRLPDQARNIPGLVEMDPILTVLGEYIIVFNHSGDQKGQISNPNIYPNSVRLWLDNRVYLIRGEDYAIDYETGEITFLTYISSSQNVYADYRYVTPKQGPFEFKKEEFNVSIIPGVVIAFGDRTQDCDKFNIVVTEDRTDVAMVYGGKFEMNFDLIAFSKDSEDREKLSDYIIMKILERQNALGFEGIELLDISPGGENEDIFNPETDEYFYESNISCTFRVDWAIYNPLPAVLLDLQMSTRISDPSIEEETSILEIGRGLTYERMI